MGKDVSVCIECGRASSQPLYKQFAGGTIQLTQCSYCGQVIDKYVEYDAVILLLDILLLRIQAYRHLIFNYGVNTSVLLKFSVMVVLCETYTKLRMLGLETSDSVLLQMHFHSLFLHSIIEIVCLFGVSFLLVKIVAQISNHMTYYDVFRAMVISSFGKLGAVAAMVWTGDYYLWVPTLLVLPAQFQALRALLGVTALRALVVVLVQTAVIFLLNGVLEEWRTLAIGQFGVVKRQ